jgi:hypothetical protein
MCVLQVPFLGPSILSLSFDSLRPNGTHYFVVVDGTNYGPAFSSPSMCTHGGGVVVTVNDVPCAALVMLVVSSLGQRLARMCMDGCDFLACTKALLCFVLLCSADAAAPVFCIPLSLLVPPPQPLQPHVRLMCTTTFKSGTLSVRTLLGQASMAYDSDNLLLPPFIRAVTPSLWDTTLPTVIEINGDRYV